MSFMEQIDINKLHTTPMGAERVRKNLKFIDAPDVVLRIQTEAVERR